MIIVQILILMLPLIIEAYLDFQKIEKSNGLNHVQNVIKVRVPLILFVSLLNGLLMSNGYPYWVNVLQSMGLCAGLFLLCYDYIMGYILHRDFFFVGTTSLLDQFWGTIGPINTFVVKALAFLWPLAFYIDLNKIIN